MIYQALSRLLIILSVASLAAPTLEKTQGTTVNKPNKLSWEKQIQSTEDILGQSVGEAVPQRSRFLTITIQTYNDESLEDTDLNNILTAMYDSEVNRSYTVSRSQSTPEIAGGRAVLLGPDWKPEFQFQHRTFNYPQDAHGVTVEAARARAQTLAMSEVSGGGADIGKILSCAISVFSFVPDNKDVIFLFRGFDTAQSWAHWAIYVNARTMELKYLPYLADQVEETPSVRFGEDAEQWPGTGNSSGSAVFDTLPLNRTGQVGTAGTASS